MLTQKVPCSTAPARVEHAARRPPVVRKGAGGPPHRFLGPKDRNLCCTRPQTEVRTRLGGCNISPVFVPRVVRGPARPWPLVGGAACVVPPRYRTDCSPPHGRTHHRSSPKAPSRHTPPVRRGAGPPLTHQDAVQRARGGPAHTAG